MLHLIFGTSFLHRSECLIQISLPLSATFIWTCLFTCYTLLSPSVTFWLFLSELIRPIPFQKIICLFYHSLFLSVGLIPWLWSDCFTRRFIFPSDFRYWLHVWLASSCLVNSLVHILFWFDLVANSAPAFSSLAFFCVHLCFRRVPPTPPPDAAATDADCFLVVFGTFFIDDRAVRC